MFHHALAWKRFGERTCARSRPGCACLPLRMPCRCGAGLYHTPQVQGCHPCACRLQQLSPPSCMQHPQLGMQPHTHQAQACSLALQTQQCPPCCPWCMLALCPQPASGSACGSSSAGDCVLDATWEQSLRWKQCHGSVATIPANMLHNARFSTMWGAHWCMVVCRAWQHGCIAFVCSCATSASSHRESRPCTHRRSLLASICEAHCGGRC
jgi:hypothetical protein